MTERKGAESASTIKAMSEGMRRGGGSTPPSPTNAEGRVETIPASRLKSFVEITGKMDGAKAAKPVRSSESKRHRNRPMRCEWKEAA